MEDLKSLYFDIENPLDNKIKWSKFLNFYSKSLNYDDFYKEIVREKTDKNLYYNKDSKKNLSLMLWSNFKTKILSFSDNDLRELIDSGYFDNSVYDAIKKISSLESIKTYEELENILTIPYINRYFNEVFEDFLNKIVISSDFNILSKYKMNTVFSMRVDPKYLYSIVNDYINECIKYEIPYLIKFNESSKKIVINFYSTINDYKTNLNTLNIIKKENFSYIFENKDLISSNINKYISVRNMNNYNSDIYSKEKISILFRSFDSVLYDYILNHSNILVAYKDGRMNINEYLANVVMEKIINQIIKDSITSNDEYYLLANSKEFIDMKRTIKERLFLNLGNILKERLYLKNNDEYIEFAITDDKVINIEVEIFMSAIRNLATPLMLKDNMLEKYFRIRIKNECEFVGIDPMKFTLSKNFKEVLFFEKNKYDKYEQELEHINEDMNKIEVYEKLINDKNNDLLRDKIKDAYLEALNSFNIEETSN